MQNGAVVEVLGSDEESDTDSLLSLTEILGRNRGNTTTSTSSPPELDEDEVEAERVRLLGSFTRGRSIPLVGRDKIRAIVAKQRDHKFDISGLMNEHFDDAVTDLAIIRAKEHQRDDGNNRGISQPDENLDSGALASVVQFGSDEEETASKLLSAVQRTEVFAADLKFSFFGRKGLNDWRSQDPPEIEIPPDESSGDTWRNKEYRSRAFLSGHIAHLASRRLIPESLLKWMFQNVVVERDDELRNAYIEALRRASPYWTRTNVTAGDVQHIFHTLGGLSDVLRDGSVVTPKPTPPERRQTHQPRFLLSALALFRAIMPDMDFAALGKLMSLIFRLALDADTMRDGRVACAVEDSLSSLLELPHLEARSYVAERLLEDAPSHLHDAALRAQLLDRILATSPFVAKVRIYLANLFLFGDSSELSVDDSSAPLSLPYLTEFLTASEFADISKHSHKNINWTNIKALTHIFEVAIADGGRPASFTSAAEEAAFNSQVDRLADAVKSIFASITDTGASHMRRTEAKEALQALHYRLIYSVRSRPRPKKNVFAVDGQSAGQERSKGFLAKFLARKKENLSQRLAAGAVDGDHEDPLKKMNNEGKGISRDRAPNFLPSQESVESSKSETETLIREQLGL